MSIPHNSTRMYTASKVSLLLSGKRHHFPGNTPQSEQLAREKEKTSAEVVCMVLRTNTRRLYPFTSVDLTVFIELIEGGQRLPEIAKKENSRVTSAEVSAKIVSVVTFRLHGLCLRIP